MVLEVRYSTRMLHRVLSVLWCVATWLSLCCATMKEPRNIPELISAVPPLPPSNLLLYPLDFQKSWQASEQAKINIEFQVPVFGPRDETKVLKEASKIYALMNQKKRANDILQKDLHYEQEQEQRFLTDYIRRLALAAHVDALKHE